MHEARWPNKIYSRMPPQRQNLAKCKTIQTTGIVQEMKVRDLETENSVHNKD
jgi:hypothetical protein